MKFNDYKFMSIGSNCANILFLGPDRIRGPVDNVLITDAYAIKFLIENTYYDYITNTNNYSLIKPLYGKGRPSDPDNWFKYKYALILHNDVRQNSYKEELFKRCKTFNSFLEKVRTTNNHYFIFTLNEGMVDTKKHCLKNKTFWYICNYLKSINLIDKVIFVQLHSPGIPHGGYANCYIDDITKWKKLFNIKVIDLYSKKELNPEKLYSDFITEVEKLKL